MLRAVAAAAAAAGAAAARTCAQIGTDLSCPASKPFSGNPYDTGDTAGCCAKCGERPGCAAWTWHASKCYLKASCDETKKESGATSGRAPAGPVPTPPPTAEPPPTPAPPSTPAPSAPPTPPGRDLPYTELFESGGEIEGKEYPCTRFPMMVAAWGASHVFSEIDAKPGDNCALGSLGMYGMNGSVGARADAHGSGHIATRSSTDGGQTWSKAEFLPFGKLVYQRDPSVLYIPAIDKICVFYNGGTTTKGEGEQSPGEIHKQCRTQTGGWDEPVSLAPGVDKECVNKIQGRPVGVVMPTGRLLITSWNLGKESICIIKSDDNGETWSRAAHIDQTSEAALVLLPDNKTVYLNARHSNSGTSDPSKSGRVVGFSTDGGETWDLEYNSKHSPPDTQSPSPGTMIVVGGRVLLAVPTTGSHDGLCVFASDDGARSWPRKVLVTGGGCYHPTLTVLPGGDAGHVGVAWEGAATKSQCKGDSCEVRFARVPIP